MELSGLDSNDTDTPLSCQEIDDFIGRLEEDGSDEEEGEVEIEPALWYTDSALDPELDPGPLLITEESQKFAAVHQKSKLRRLSRTKFGGELETTLLTMTLFNGEVWLCLKCQFKHSSKAGVLNHVYNYHCPDLIKCSQCSFETTSQLDLQNHSRAHKVTPRRDISGTVQNDFQLMESSLLSSAAFIDGNWLCNVCEFGPSNRDNVLNHIECFHPPPGFMGYKCPKCDLQQRCRLSLRSHMESVHKEKSHQLQPVGETKAGGKVGGKNVVYVFRCKWCKKVFSERPKLHQHLREDHGQNSQERRRFNCSFCPFHCYDVEEIKSHLSSQHSAQKSVPSGGSRLHADQARNYICPICSVRFLDETSYKRHIEVDEGFRFSCSLCGSVFKDEETLNFHLIYSEDCSRSIKRVPTSSFSSPVIQTRTVRTTPRYIKPRPPAEAPAGTDLTLEETCSSLIDILQNVPGQEEDRRLGPQSFVINNGVLQVNSEAGSAVRKPNILLGVRDSQGQVKLINSSKQISIPRLVKRKADEGEDKSESEPVKSIKTEAESILEPGDGEASHVKSEKTEETFFSCSKCQERFSHKQELGKHLLTHLKASPASRIEQIEEVKPSVSELSCKICQQTFSEKSELGKHLLQHLKEGIKCPSCPAVHHDLASARDHRKLHQN